MLNKKLVLEDVKNHKNFLGELDINSFYNNFVKQGFYRGINRENLEARYKRSYEIFKYNENSPVKVEPPPLAPEEILKSRAINEEDVIGLEVNVAIMFAGGLSVLKSLFSDADISNPYKEFY